MGFEVKFDALDTLYGGVYSRSGAWSSALSEVSNRVGTLISSDNMSGEGADSAKLYLDSVHNTIIPMLADLIRLHVNNCLLYVTDYQSNIDTALHAVINESELTDIKDSLKLDAENASDIDDEVQKALKSVSDLVSVSCKGMSTVSSKNTSIRNKITALIDDITSLEDSHSQRDFTETSDLIETLTAFINERLGDTRAFKTNFSVDTIANSASFQAMYQAYLAVNEKNAENQDAVSVAAEKENERIEALQEEYQQMLEEYEKRQKEAESEKWIVTGLCVVGSIIAIAATGGTATPLVVGAVSAISGAVMAGNSAAADQYVEYGWNVSEWNWTGIGTSALLGGVSGFITGYVGAGLSNAVTSSLSGSAGTLLNSSHMVVRIGTNAVIGSASEVLSGIGARGATTFVSALIATGGDISASLNTAVDAASNLKSIVFDAALGATVSSVRGIQEPIKTESIEVDDFEFYKNLVEDLDVSTEPNTAVFYSGKGNRALAEEFALENGKTTLEMTTGGSYLDSLELFGENSPLSEEEALNVWSRLSERYAQEASGNAYGFVNGSNPNSIFNTVEYPELLKNPRITNIFTELMK